MMSKFNNVAKVGRTRWVGHVSRMAGHNPVKFLFITDLFGTRNWVAVQVEWRMESGSQELSSAAYYCWLCVILMMLHKWMYVHMYDVTSPRLNDGEVLLCSLRSLEQPFRILLYVSGIVCYWKKKIMSFLQSLFLLHPKFLDLFSRKYDSCLAMWTQSTYTRTT